MWYWSIKRLSRSWFPLILRTRLRVFPRRQVPVSLKNLNVFRIGGARGSRSIICCAIGRGDSAEVEAYLDTSVLLRVVLLEPDRVKDLSSYRTLYSSALLRTEAYRTLFRIRLENRFTEEETSTVFSTLISVLGAVSLIALTPAILNGAEQFFPTAIGTLDAIHLVSALGLQKKRPLVKAFFTHDIQLGRAAQSMGLRVRGV